MPVSQVVLNAGAAVQLVDGTKHSGPGLPQSGMIKNVSTSVATIFIGDTAAVTAATGYPLAAGESASFDVVNQSLWAIAAAGAPTAFVFSRY